MNFDLYALHYLGANVLTKDEKILIASVCAAILIGACVNICKIHLYRPAHNYPANPLEVEAPVLKLININTADENALIALKGIGPEMAARVIAYRTKAGSFHSKEDLMKVRGIGQKKYDAIKDKITTE